MAKRHTCNDPMLWDEPCAACEGEEQVSKHRKNREERPEKLGIPSHRDDEKDE